MAVVLGVGCEVAATLLGTAGKQLVSYSARVEPAKRACAFKASGLAITTLLGPVADSAAYAFAPQSIIAPLNGLDIVWNTCTAPYTLGERLTRRHVLGTGLVFLGAALTSLFGPHRSDAHTLARLENIFLGWRFAFYSVLFLTGVVCGATALRRRPKGVGDKTRGVILGTMAGAIAGNMFFTAQALGLLRESITSGDWSPWHNWLPWAVALGAVSVAIANIPLMAQGLQEFEALFIVTLFEGSHICIACISGQVVLREMVGEPAWRIAMYWMSVWVIVCGLVVVQSTAARGKGRLSKEEALELIGVQELATPRSIVVSSTRSSSQRATPMLADHAGAPTRPMTTQGPASEADPELAEGSCPGSVVVWASGVSGIAFSAGAIQLDEGSTSSEASDEDNSTASESPTEKKV